jgi:hypothetical protein
MEESQLNSPICHPILSIRVSAERAGLARAGHAMSSSRGRDSIWSPSYIFESDRE